MNENLKSLLSKLGAEWISPAKAQPPSGPGVRLTATAPPPL
jgi:hypothetical protein